jgi:amino acid transporter
MSITGDQGRQEPLALTSHANVEQIYPEKIGYRLKRIFLGRAFVTEQLGYERLNRFVALGVLAPDCISSSAYGTEEILTQMTPFIGIAAFSLVVPVMFLILGVLFLVTTSYFDVIKYYTKSGGAYVVARENFGPRIAQIAAVALLIDYIVTVAVQTAAGTAALTSAVPNLVPYTLLITVGVVAILIYGNLRGIREAGSYFALPTYLYVSVMLATIAVGIIKKVSGSLHVLSIPSHSLLFGGQFGQKGTGVLMGLSFLSFLRAYANGGSSLTGLEAISNGVASFKKPESANARKTLVVMSSVLGTLLLGVTLLASWTHAVPYASGSPTVVSQEVLDIFGSHGLGHVFFYFVQFATLLILYTGANTSFNGFPFLASYVATDGFLPHQLTKRGHRLAFSNGIIVLGIVSVTLLVAFNAQLNALVALYAIGVFTGFTLAGAGLTKRYLVNRGPRWRLGVFINAGSATVTALVVVIFLTVKFAEGAWLIAVIGPIMYFALMRFHRTYKREAEAFLAEDRSQLSAPKMRRIVVFVDSFDLAAKRAIEYARSLNAYSVRAVHFDIDPIVTKSLEKAWLDSSMAKSGISLEIVECNDRRIDRGALEFVADIVRDPEVFCMAILPRRSFTSRIQRLLHDRTADSIADAISRVPRTSATIVPFRAASKAMLDLGELPADSVTRGGRRDSAHLEADLKLDERSAGAEPIGDLQARKFANIAGRVRSISVGHVGTGHEMRCVIADQSGSITLVFQGRESVPGIERGTRLIVTGTVQNQQHEAVILNPTYEIVAGPAALD